MSNLLDRPDMEFGIRDIKAWDDQWTDKFEHYQQDIRHAYYIRSILESRENNLLEIAAGSFRDMGALNRWGYKCFGIDYSSVSVLKAKDWFADYAGRIRRMNAFDMQFEDGMFDLSFHNGFWGYFDDNEIKGLLAEQARVTRYRVVATVHNRHNAQFVEYFNRLTEKDRLYKLRFFEVDEIADLMKTVCREVEVIPVGKGKRLYEDDLINIGLGDACYLKRSFDYHGMDLLPVSERLMCIGRL